tara:strand:+ start:3516 stop:3704 length:189 start_codon:yes stop_codon:yes gene_type:complete
MSEDEFIKEVFEIACGDGAYHNEELALKAEPRAFGFEEVLERLREFSDDALRYTNQEMFEEK